jgi:hypothetical protein
MNCLPHCGKEAGLFTTGSGWQFSFCEALGNSPDVFFVPEWLPREVFAEGVLRIDILEFAPNATSLSALNFSGSVRPSWNEIPRPNRRPQVGIAKVTSPFLGSQDF